MYQKHAENLDCDMTEPVKFGVSTYKINSQLEYGQLATAPASSSYPLLYHWIPIAESYFNQWLNIHTLLQGWVQGVTFPAS